AQTFRIVGGKRVSHRAIRPFEASSRWLPLWTLAAPVQRKQTRHAFDHHLAQVGNRLANKRDLARCFAEALAPERNTPHPFGACAVFSRPAPTENEPMPPRVTLRRQLIVARPDFPIFQQCLARVR